MTHQPARRLFESETGCTVTTVFAVYNYEEEQRWISAQIETASTSSTTSGTRQRKPNPKPKSRKSGQVKRPAEQFVRGCISNGLARQPRPRDRYPQLPPSLSGPLSGDGPSSPPLNGPKRP